MIQTKRTNTEEVQRDTIGSVGMNSDPSSMSLPVIKPVPLIGAPTQMVPGNALGSYFGIDHMKLLQLNNMIISIKNQFLDVLGMETTPNVPDPFRK